MGRMSTKSKRPAAPAVKQGPTGKRSVKSRLLKAVFGTDERQNEKSAAETQKGVDTASAPSYAELEQQSPVNRPSQESRKMTLTFKILSKNGKHAIYAGASVPVRFPLAAFPGKVPAQEIAVGEGIFAEPKQPKRKLTKEERAALPKPTLAEKAAMLEEKARKMREQAAKDAQLAEASM